MLTPPMREGFLFDYYINGISISLGAKEGSGY